MANPSTERRILRFDEFEADLHSFELRKRGRKVRLQNKPFLLLAALLERAGDVTREELQERLWRDDTVVVFDDNLNTAPGSFVSRSGTRRRALASSRPCPGGVTVSLACFKKAQHGSGTEHVGFNLIPCFRSRTSLAIRPRNISRTE